MSSQHDTASRMMAGLQRTLATLCCAALAACGGGLAPTGDDGLGPLARTYLGSLTVAPNLIALAQGQTATVRVDTNLLPPTDGVTGYAIGLSESDAHIQIATAACPAATGSASCRDWTITLDPGAVPGDHNIAITSVGARSGVLSGDLRVRVVGTPVQTAAVAVDHGSAETDAFSMFDGPTLVLLTDGRIAAAGANGSGEVGVGYRPFADPPSAQGGRYSPQPWFVDEFVVVANGPEFEKTVGGRTLGRWTAIAASADRSFALRDDKTVWAWGVPPGDQGSDQPFAPRKFTHVPPIKAISAGRTAGALALAEDNRVWLLEDLDYQFHLSQPPPKLITARSQGGSRPLENVAAIAGSVDATALFITLDGSVWLQHAEQDDAQQLPGLPAAATRIATTRYRKGVSRHFYLILLADGTLIEGRHDAAGENTRTVTLPGANFTDIAAGAEFAYARRADGTLWSWRPFATSPAQVAGLSDVVALGPDHVVRGSCPNRSGQVWRILNGSDAARLRGFNSDIGCAETSTPAVTLTLEVSGSGAVEVLTTGLVCRGHCEVTVQPGALIRLRGPFSSRGYGIGDPRCAFSALKEDVAFSLLSNITCTYAFQPPGPSGDTTPLTIALDGAGSVTSSPPGINCGTDCSEDLRAAYTFLTPTPASGYQFDGFIGAWDCERGVIDLFARRSASSEVAGTGAPTSMSPVCTARFVPVAAPPSSRLDVVVSGRGVVVSVPAAINCGPVCSAVFPVGTTLALDTRPEAGHRFSGWDGHPDCADNALTMAANRNCTAVFEGIAPPPAPLGLIATASIASVELAWVGPLRPVASYELRRTPGTNGATSRTVIFDAPARNFVDTAVAGGTTYRYELVARHSGGTSPPATTFATTPVSASWTRIGANEIDLRAGFAQPALALTADGNTVAVAQVFPTDGLDQTLVHRNDVFTPNSWTRLAGSPGGALAPLGPGAQPSLVLDSQGAAVVAWVQVTASGNDVRVARYDSASAQWVQIGGVLDANLGAGLNDAFQPELVLDSNDRPLVAWLQGGSVFVKRWTGAAWAAVGTGVGANANANAVKLVLDGAGTPLMLVRTGSGDATQLFAYRESAGAWAALGGALNAPLAGFRDSLPFFGLTYDVDGSPLAVWSEGSLAYVVHASRWRNGAWQSLPDIASETNFAITGLAVARSVQAPSLTPTPPVVMLARQPIFVGANPRNAYGDVHLLQNDAWTARPTLITFGPMLGLTLSVTRLATPIAAWLAETGSVGSGELRLFVWRGL